MRRDNPKAGLIMKLMKQTKIQRINEMKCD